MKAESTTELLIKSELVGTMKSLREQVAELEGWTHDTLDLPMKLSYLWKTPEGRVSYACSYPDFPPDLPPYDTSSDTILAAIRRRFSDEEKLGLFLESLGEVLFGDPYIWDMASQSDLFALATATPEQLCRAFISAAASTAA